LATILFGSTGTALLLFQLFSNLVANAVKYSPGGGTIRLAACAKGALLVVTVKDEGIGIPKSDLDRLFERYYRGGNVAGIVGTGLGLFLAKIVVELHDGAIEVESVEGGGSCLHDFPALCPQGCGSGEYPARK